jgi:tRNA 5-methylaminomethyl-2-thiouridine biosynthesis bifunctional protein
MGSRLRLDQPRLVPRLPGLYVLTALASRGIAWSLLGARSVAALMSGAPCPLDASLLDAVDAGRFVARAARRG